MLSYLMTTAPRPNGLRASVFPFDHATSGTQADLYFDHLDPEGRVVGGIGPLLADAVLDGSRAAAKLPFEAPRPIRGHRFARVGVAATTLYYRWRDRRD